MSNSQGVLFFLSASICGELEFGIYITQTKYGGNYLLDHSRSQRRTRKHTHLPSRLMIDDDGERVGIKQILVKFEAADPRGC